MWCARKSLLAALAHKKSLRGLLLFCTGRQRRAQKSKKRKNARRKYVLESGTDSDSDLEAEASDYGRVSGVKNVIKIKILRQGHYQQIRQVINMYITENM